MISQQIRIPFGKTSLTDYQKTQETQLGHGSYGTVFKAKYKGSIQVAIKQIANSMQNQGFPSTSIRQISLLRELSNPHIVKLLDVITHEKKLYLVFEYLNFDLKFFIDDARKKIEKGEAKCRQDVINQKIIKQIMYHLLLGVAKIHEKRIIHRDLKPANILLDNKLTAKIADFGLARSYSIATRPYSQQVVTQYYRAPQLLMGQTCYSIAIDIWSLGCIFAELYLLKMLFFGDSVDDQRIRIFRMLGTPDEDSWPGFEKFKQYSCQFPRFPEGELEQVFKHMNNMDEQAMDLMKKMLVLNPAKRITAKQALKHSYFNSIINNSNININSNK